MRLMPALPDALVNYASGLTRLHRWQVALGTAVGAFPRELGRRRLGVAWHQRRCAPALAVILLARRLGIGPRAAWAKLRGGAAGRMSAPPTPRTPTVRPGHTALAFAVSALLAMIGLALLLRRVSFQLTGNELDDLGTEVRSARRKSAMGDKRLQQKSKTQPRPRPLGDHQRPLALKQGPRRNKPINPGVIHAADPAQRADKRAPVTRDGGS